MMKRLIKWAFFLVLVLIAGGYFGVFHPASDSLSVFRPQLGILLIVLSVLISFFHLKWMPIIGLAAATFALFPMFSPTRQAQEDALHLLHLYQKNMLFRVDDPSRLGRDILELEPDILTLQEVSGANMALFDTIGDRYPSRQFCPFATIGGVAVVSRWPVVPGSGFCAEADGLAAMKISTPEGELWVASIHLHWPWPYGQPAHVDRLLAFLEKLDGPVAIGGDFNMAPWSYTMSRIEHASGASTIGPVRVSLTKAGGWLRVPIDHILVTGGKGQTARRPRLGSDHFGLSAHFWIPDAGR